MLAFVPSVRTRNAPPVLIVDAATWSAIGPLSEESVAAMPDFTRGKWKDNPKFETRGEAV